MLLSCRISLTILILCIPQTLLPAEQIFSTADLSPSKLSSLSNRKDKQSYVLTYLSIVLELVEKPLPANHIVPLPYA